MDISVSLSLYRLLVSDIKICIECRQPKPLMTLNVALNHAIQFLQADRQSGATMLVLVIGSQLQL